MSLRTPLKAFQREAVNSAVAVLGQALQRKSHTRMAHTRDSGELARHRREEGCVLLEAPTGSGKTLMAAHMAQDLTRHGKIVWFWFTPFSGLALQTARSIRNEGFGLRVRDLAADRLVETARSGDLFVTTWASSAVSNAESRRVRRGSETMPALDQFLTVLRASGFGIGVIIDEAHHGFRGGTQAAGFYRDVLRPDLTLLMTATPRDRDLDAFLELMGRPSLHRVSVARQRGVDAGLLKKGVRVGLLRVNQETPQDRTAFEETAIRCGVTTHQQLKLELAAGGFSLQPLLLIQVDSRENSVQDALEAAIRCGIPEGAVRIHTADEPDPDLMALAHDDNVEALIFKMAVATGFDAPRAFTLVSLRSARDPAFGVQVVGRLMRVDRRLQNVVHSPVLDYAYVFLSDHSRQQGLLDAAGRINTISDELGQVSASVEVQTFGLDSPGTAALDEGFEGEDAHLLNGWGLGPDPSTAGPHSQRGEQTLWPMRSRFSAPTSLLRAVVSPDQQGLLAEIVGLFPFDDLITLIQRDATRIIEEASEGFPLIRDRPDEMRAQLARRETARQAQRTLLDAVGDGFLDIRKLHDALELALRQECQNRGLIELAQSPDQLTAGLHTILALRSRALREAIREATQHHLEAVEAALLPASLEDDTGERARLNLYGIFPSDLNLWQRQFAHLLDDDQGGTVAWWHHNPPRQPSSVAVPLPGQRQPTLFPDFVVGVPERRRSQGVLLVEVRRDLNDERARMQAVHPVYQRVLAVHLDHNRDWRVVEDDARQDCTRLGPPLRVEQLKDL